MNKYETPKIEVVVFTSDYVFTTYDTSNWTEIDVFSHNSVSSNEMK
ncbi:MAG: hypothetical protein LUF29_08850 [Oscillospiraceae bacterium]|nr:hypothetical protein [Oscillospiraceae bacterium]